MQYGNPYFSQPFQQIQPYQDRLAQLQNSYIIRNLTEMWSDADATLRQSMKTDLTRLVQQMN